MKIWVWNSDALECLICEFTTQQKLQQFHHLWIYVFNDDDRIDRQELHEFVDRKLMCDIPKWLTAGEEP